MALVRTLRKPVDGELVLGRRADPRWGYDVVRSAVTTVDGPLDLTAPNWAWQPEGLVVAEASP